MTTSLSGFIEFVRADMGITPDQVPDNSPSFTLAYGGAVEWVNRDIELVMPHLYAVAVYNLAASFLANYGTESVFSEFRQKLGLNNIATGVITGAGDSLVCVMRGDIQTGDHIKMPQKARPMIQASSYSQYRDDSAFSGEFMVNAVRLLGNSRQPTAEAWVAIIEASPAVQVGQQ